ncbi:MAG: FHA domain-containing protein [Candidatus Eremiobacteraeota bacterium]|nr:FHA domain-containing protein [Candidatus Eremiobacteraeota bacterium]
MICPDCGAENPEDNEFCDDCGARLVTGTAPRPLQTQEEKADSEMGIPDKVAGEDMVGSVEENSEIIGRELVPYLLSVHTGNRYPLEEFPALIGRKSSAEGIEPEVDLTEEDSEHYVSRRHGQIMIKDGAYFYEDLHSSNGSLINDEFIEPGEPQPINDGALLRVGRTELLFRTQI